MITCFRVVYINRSPISILSSFTKFSRLTLLNLLMRIVDLNICCGYFPMVHNDRLLGVLRDSSRDKSDHLRRISRPHSRQHWLPR